MSDDLTAAWLDGFEKGKDSARAALASLQARNERMRETLEWLRDMHHEGEGEFNDRILASLSASTPAEALGMAQIPPTKPQVAPIAGMRNGVEGVYYVREISPGEEVLDWMPLDPDAILGPHSDPPATSAEAQQPNSASASTPEDNPR
jgi:hypothetical protein